MTLKHLLAEADVTPTEIAGDADLTSMDLDSRRTRPGGLFVCMPETGRPSEGFIPAAKQNGAVAAIVHSPQGMQLAVQNGLAAALIPHRGELFENAIWRLCDVFFEHPTRHMKVIGVTGTNGKTTTAWLIRDMLRSCGLRTAYLGTLGFGLPDEHRELQNTTPMAVELYNLLAEARDLGIEALAMEVSSHSLAQRRVDGVEFDAAVFTNLTQDHLDYHGDMASYAEAKHRLFTVLPTQTHKRFVAAFNVDDPRGARWALEQNGATVTYGMDAPEADVRGQAVEVRVDGIRLKLGYEGEREVRVPLGGNYNVENAISATAGMIALGFSFPVVCDALEKVHPVPGRFETVDNDLGIGVLVDYAHTPDAVEKLLLSVRQLEHRRVITVFGCGGDRDRTKRPKMARVASELSDLTVVTSDNPRTEDPEAIVKEVSTGIASGRESICIVDRAEAIDYAIGRAGPGDVVVLAGKGHENYQIIGHTKHFMDDRLMAKEALARRGAK
jgi:UDP-N-acetylmuramoyl-L-alanyl-D-glutamate--2,6-diaminopimelate ligase